MTAKDLTIQVFEPERTAAVICPLCQAQLSRKGLQVDVLTLAYDSHIQHWHQPPRFGAACSPCARCGG